MAGCGRIGPVTCQARWFLGLTRQAAPRRHRRPILQERPAGPTPQEITAVQHAWGVAAAQTAKVVNYTNCVQCGAITAKGGRLTPPEGGDGPLYQNL